MDVRNQRILILGAAGRDFHQFNTQYRQCDTVEVVGFTAAQVGTIFSHGMRVLGRMILMRLTPYKKMSTRLPKPKRNPDPPY